MVSLSCNTQTFMHLTTCPLRNKILGAVYLASRSSFFDGFSEQWEGGNKEGRAGDIVGDGDNGHGDSLGRSPSRRLEQDECGRAARGLRRGGH